MNNKCINNKKIIVEYYIFDWNKIKNLFWNFRRSDPDQLFHETDPRIRIQIKMK